MPQQQGRYKQMSLSSNASSSVEDALSLSLSFNRLHVDFTSWETYGFETSLCNDFSNALGKTGKLPVELSVWMPVIIVFIFSFVGLIHVNQK